MKLSSRPIWLPFTHGNGDTKLDWLSQVNSDNNITRIGHPARLSRYDSAMTLVSCYRLQSGRLWQLLPSSMPSQSPARLGHCLDVHPHRRAQSSRPGQGLRVLAIRLWRCTWPEPAQSAQHVSLVVPSGSAWQSHGPSSLYGSSQDRQAPVSGSTTQLKHLGSQFAIALLLPATEGEAHDCNEGSYAEHYERHRNSNGDCCAQNFHHCNLSA